MICFIQGEHETRTAAQFAADRDLAPVCAHQMLDDGKPEARALRFART